MSTKWEVYDNLISGIPSGIKVLDFCVGTYWTYVKTSEGTGIAMTVRQRAGEKQLKTSLLGMDLKEVSKLVKSWNFVEASIGMAAINSWYNRPDHIKEMGIFPEENERTKNEAFKILMDDIKGKNVTVVGHFPYIEKLWGPICNLSILERDPSDGDLPDSACEYIMEDQDCVVITGMTFTNKTLPRLLELCRKDAIVCLTGPSVPMAECLREYGVTNLSGFCVTDEEKIAQILRTGLSNRVFDCGYMLDCRFS